ncbi:hypothetical protein DBR12_13225 [Acidovorax sp. HMWF029]|nr:hypothetical protein DBR12_13225 [Acidovorax sp. HMWF029]
MSSWSSTSPELTKGQPPEALCAFPLLSNGCAIREGRRPRRGGAALARGHWSGLRACYRSDLTRTTEKGL